MRATATPASIRKGKRRLLESCAIAAGMAALALGGPALAQVSGTGSFVTGGGGGSTITDNSGTNTTTVNLGANQSIINWVPTDTSTTTTNPIDFLATGENLNFIGTGQYTVLNRFVDGSGGSLSRQIALNGTVNSFVGATTGPRGGNIWFYNAGGILIGATGVINVGSLVLTANDIDTSGGLLGPGNTIRFRGLAGTSAVAVNGAINANNVGNPGSSYVALVAPRVVQAGNVRVDGSAAYVAAEQADIRINGGLFDINVLVGAEGGNVITHTGNTTGPAHQDGDTDQNRIYMVAIPKNDAVTMLVSGAIGYDDAVSATEADGAIRLSAGYNVTLGEVNATPVNATAANITAGDTLFRSSTYARASGAFAGQPTQSLPASPPPLSSSGQFFVEGSGTFIGDASARLTIGAGQSGGATGTLTVQSGGANGTPGNAAVNVTGGTLSAPGALTIRASGDVQTLTGDSQGGIASLTITGGSVSSSGVTVEANGLADVGTNGTGGDGRGGTASITVSGAGSTLTAGNIFINSAGVGAGPFFDGSGNYGVVDMGGDGQGGTSILTMANGGSVGPVTLLSLNASGLGVTGLVQSGSGIGGTARIDLSGAGSSLSTTQTFVQAGAGGGGSFSNPFGTFETQNGGNATGGTAEIILNADATATASLGSVLIEGLARLGNASGSENASGGDMLGGAATLTADGGINAQFTDIVLNASARVDGAGSPSGTSGQNGTARANNVTLAATNGSTIAASGDIRLFAVGMGVAGENFGTGQGGNIVVNAASGGTISSANQFIVQAMGGSSSSAIGQSAGNGTGGNIDLTADGGTIQADIYAIDASANTVNVTGAGGAAQGGTIDLIASNGGQILALLDSGSQFDASATTGVSANGSAATGGGIRFIANGGTLGFDAGSTATLIANGTSGGATAPGAGGSTGTGGSILIQAVADALNSSAIDLGDFDASADGRTAVDLESNPALPSESAGNGQGGSTRFDIQGGTLTASSISVSANGFGGNAAGGSTGTGGTATFTQTGGDVNVGDMTISANGFGGVAPDQSGAGIGGITTIDLLGGTITAADIIANANGLGGQGSQGNDDDPANIIPGGLGGTGQGGAATINIDGSAVVDASIIVANAAGRGGAGGDFVNASSFGGLPGTPGNGGAGNGGAATVNVIGGTTTTSSMIADASGIGGDGGNSFFSSSSGGATGVGVGGTGGTGQGGTATIALQTAIDTVGIANSVARGTGGNGGDHNVGGNGGDGFGGVAQAIVTNFEAGELAVTVDSTGLGGNGTDGRDGAGGNGGNGAGGTARMLADGPGASLTVVETNFINGGTGGNGGAGGLGFGSFVAVAPSGGNGGNGQGGTIEVVANEGATISLGLASGDSVVFGSTGTGGNGGTGSDSNFGEGQQAGDGGNGGGGSGGSVRLATGGGTITSNGESVEINASGVSGTSGVGGAGQGGGINGANGGFSGTAGGRVVIEALNGLSGPGQIALGNTSITANGDIAGRIELSTEGNLGFAGLDAEALGFANPTNNDTDVAPAGIFLAMNGGTIASQGDVSLTTDSSVGAYAQSNGIFDVDGILTVGAGDQIDVRHDFREGVAPTIRASDSLIATALNSISGAPGSLVSAGATLSLETTGVTGTIGVDRLGGTDITINSNGAASVEHAEAANDFTATAGSFRTGLNSIITGGDIVITSPGAVDLGNSTAGGFVSVGGQSIVFNSINAGTTVDLNATGTANGAEGIRGGSITAGGNVNLFGNSIALTGTLQGAASLFAFAGGGNTAIALADVDGNIGIVASGDITGSYAAGGNISLTADGNIVAEANAAGGYVDPNGITAEGLVFADADGNATLTNSSAATMLGVRAGQAATVSNAAAGEDVLVVAGTTATLASITAGDDLTATAPGGITANGLATTGAGSDDRALIYGPSSSSGLNILQIVTSAADSSNITLTASAGNIGGGTINAFDNLTATASGAVTTTGTIGSGLATRVDAGSISFEAIDAGSTVDLTAVGAISGADITAGNDINLGGNNIALTGTVSGDASLFATGSGGIVGINQANVDGNISIVAAGDLTGTYVAGGDVRLNSGANINASATANGGFMNSSGGTAEGNVFVDAAGNVVLANSTAARMFGVNSGGSATITGAAAGEDFLVLAGTTASLTNIGAGDDLDIRTGGDLAANNVRATGAGADTHFLNYLPGNGFTIAQGEGVSSINGSDVSLSAGGSIDASALSAGDDIAAIASGTIGIAGAETLGLGVTAGGSNIRTQGGDTVLAGLDSFNDVLVDSTGRVNATGTVEAGRDVAINANDVSLAGLTAPGGNALQTISASGNVTINSANAIGGGRVLGQGNVILTAGTAIDMLGVAGGTVNLDGATGIAVEAIQSVGTTTLNSDDGAILAGSLVSNGEIDARANSIRIDSGGDMIFTNLITDVGDAVVRAGGDLFVTNGSVTGTADLRSDGERLGIGTLTAANAALAADGGFMTLNNVTVTNALDASARGSLLIDGIVTGRNISLASADISIGTAARVGTSGTTQGLSITNNDSDNQTFIGGTGTRSGYHIDAAELTRVFGTDVRILAPEVAAAGGGSVGSAAPPDVVVDSFTFTGGAAGSNLGANGSLTIETPGKMRVIGNVQLTGLADTNALNLFAGEALEVILGQGTVRLTGAGNAPGGQLNMASDDIIVATMDAIADVGAAATTAAINTRLGENDGVLLDEGALFARGIRADVAGGFYVQNSGAGTDFGQRRGLTFGAGGLDVRTGGPSRIVINGVQLGPSGQVTGLDTIPLLTIAGAAPVAGSFDPRSTFNGCVIANTGACIAVTFENSFPVQDVIEEEADAEGDDGDGNSLPVPLITMRDLDPLSGEPLLDDPVTGAGNDDLWTTPGD
ncbi:beta strand repeat-containing protein [Sphingopyxis sp.]|uniref:beta strand repeat-containing protein n=1 Tax=Sphingopyxis sp. TaxID=1908224 RepID=UPI002FCA3AC7